MIQESKEMARVMENYLFNLRTLFKSMAKFNLLLQLLVANFDEFFARSWSNDYSILALLLFQNSQLLLKFFYSQEEFFLLKECIAIQYARTTLCSKNYWW